MALCFHATDLHGHPGRYRALFAAVEAGRPRVLLLGGDLLPHAEARSEDGSASWVEAHLAAPLRRLREAMGADFPAVLLILGNDDGRLCLPEIERFAVEGLWTHLHGRRIEVEGTPFYGYAYVPPTPFSLKDWERYDVSRYTPPGCVSPEEGRYSVEVDRRRVRFATIRDDLKALAGRDDLRRAVFLFHGPPAETNLDRAALDGRMIEHVPLDVHVGSIAVRRFLEQRAPRVSLHGHIHESARLMGSWRDRVGATLCLGGAHDGPELALVRFDTENPEQARRDLLLPESERHADPSA